MNRRIFSKINVGLPVFVLTGLVVATGVTGYFYYRGNENTKATALLGGLVAGLLLVILQFLFSWTEYVALSKVTSLGIKDILVHRDDREFYKAIIAKSSSRIWIMGVTANRFMEHFADSDSDRQDTKVLLEALSRGVEVRILIPLLQNLPDDKDKQKAESVGEAFAKTGATYSNFYVRYFSHEPAHSIFVADQSCILGPVFPGVASKDTPAIYMSAESKYAEKYLSYFDTEWKNASQITP